MGHPLTSEQLTAAFNSIDTSGDGRISWQEFQAWWSQSDRFGAFEMTDAQASEDYARREAEVSVNVRRKGCAVKFGSTTKEGEWMAFGPVCLSTLTLPLQPQWLGHVTSHFAYFDKDHSGTISRDEFPALYKNLREAG